MKKKPAKRKTVASLKQTQENLRNIIDTAPVTMSWINSDLTYQGVNKKLAKIIGISTKEILGQKIGFKGKHDAFYKFITTIFKKKSKICKAQLQIDIGTNKRCFYTVAKKYNANKEAVVIGVDITELKKAEGAAIKENEFKHRTFIQKIPDLVLKMDHHGCIVFTNEAILNLGYKPKDVIGKHFSTIIHPDDVSHISRDIILPKYKGRLGSIEALPKIFDERRTGKRKTVNLEVRLIPKKWDQSSDDLDNSSKIKFSNISYGDVTSYGEYNRDIDEKEKKLVGSIAIIRDITIRKIAEKKLKEITNQLIQNEKMVALGEMAAGIAHEVNQPLNSIKLISQDIVRDIQKKRFSPENLEQDLQSIDKEINRISDIVNHIRLFSRISKSEKTNKININIAIEGLFKLIGEQLRVKNYVVKIDLSNDLPLIFADQIKLEHVFMNIINNAKDAMDMLNGDKKIMTIKSFYLRKSKNQQAKVVVEITDNGCGIKENIMHRIREPFYTTKAPGFGTGLGLSLANKIITGYGGTIEIQSKENVGSTFKVILPV